MTEINLFQIPDFLKNTHLGKTFLSEANEYEIGSKEWIFAMGETQTVKFFAKTDEIKNLDEFYNLIEVCLYWDDNFITPSIYVYFLLNKEECVTKLVDEYMKKANLSYEIIRNYYEEYKSLVSSYYNDIEGKYSGIIGNVFSFFVLNKFGISETRDVLILIEHFIDYYHELEPLKQIIIILTQFHELYDEQKEHINEIPLIPFKSQIFNKNYHKKYRVSIINNGSTINVAYDYNISFDIYGLNFSLILAFINSLKSNKTKKPIPFNYGFTTNKLIYSPINEYPWKIAFGSLTINELTNYDGYFEEDMYLNDILQQLIYQRDELIKTEFKNYAGREDKYIMIGRNLMEFV